MPSKVQLIGGAFQDSEGNVLVNGYLTLRLSNDASISGVGNICSGVEITIQLDADGNVIASPAQSVWGNDNLLPVNTYYRVTGFTKAGQPAWGPNNQQIEGSGTFDLGTWVPNSVISWQPVVNQPVVFENNGTINSSQTILNLESLDSSITITDEGGGTLNLKASTGGVSASVLFSDGSMNLLYPSNEGVDAAGGNAMSDQLNGVLISVLASITINHVAFIPTETANPSRTVSFAIYSEDGNTKLLDSGSIVFTGTSGIVLSTMLSAPVTLPPGNYWFMQTGNPATGVQCRGWVTRYTVNNTNQQLIDLFATTGTRLAFAANARSGGVMPSTLGALTPQTYLTCNGIVEVMFY